jgi:Putative MetA-pathway of phenol degradation
MCSLVLSFIGGPAWAHDPIFGLGPHVLYQGGVEITPDIRLDERGDKRDIESNMELTYGLTGDWAAGVELPYAFKKAGHEESDGLGDFRLFTKYRFWRHDTLGAQESVAALLKVNLDTGDADESPALGTGATDTILGLTYGYESRKWYRWASARYRLNGENAGGLQRGDKFLVDLVVGIRPTPTTYLEPDTVWMLELNGEFGQRADLNGATLRDSGGVEWFLSPGVFWTIRNFAIKAGVQIPVYADLNGNQDESDYRAKVVFEWHL